MRLRLVAVPVFLLSVSLFLVSWRGGTLKNELPPVVIDCDCGRVEVNGTVAKIVAIRNPTRSKLTIKKIIASCGCVTKSTDRQQIDPGTEAELSFVYQAAPAPAAVRQHVEISFEEFKTPITVNIVGTVVSWYVRTIGNFGFDAVIAGTMSSPRIVEIELEENCALDEIEVDSQNPSLEISPTISETDPKKIQLRAIYRGDTDGQFGRRAGVALFRWKGKERRQLTIPWSASIVAQSDIIPQVANFGILSADYPKRAKVTWKQQLGQTRLRANEVLSKHELDSAFQMTFSDGEDDAICIDMTLSPPVLAKAGKFEAIAEVVKSDGTVVAQIG